MATVGGGIIAWFTRLERRLAGKMSIADHAALCGPQNEEVKTMLSEIQRKLEEQNTRAAAAREATTKTLGEMAIDIAVVQTKLGVVRRRRITRED